jgi:uncharacterized repeat protein (TIGR02543 family)
MAVEHALVRTVSGAGSVSGSDGFQTAGSSVQLSATAQAGYQFAGWAGSASGTANPLTLVMDGPKSVVAQFTPAPVSVRLESNTGSAQFTVSGAGCPAGTYTAPANLSWLNASGCVINVASPVGGSDSRSVFSGWADGSGSNPRTVVASPGAVYTFVLATEHRLTRGVSGPGSVSGADGFRAAGSTVQLAATPQAGYQFAGWSGSVSGVLNPISFVMDGPKSVTANFTAAPTGVRFLSNVGGTQFTVSGSGCPAGTYTAAVDVVWAYGVACSVAVLSPHGGLDTRYVFAGWVDGPTANTRTITALPGAVYTLNFNTEHRLTRSVSGAGTVSGADGFYAVGSQVQFTATPAAGQQFTGWSGTGGGSANPVSIRIDAPTTMVANFAPIPKAGIAVESMSPLVGAGPSGTFTATFSHGGGSSELYLGYMLFLPTSNVVQYTAKGSCLIEYNRISNGMRLIDDPGTGWLGPISGVPLSPVAGTLSNSQCSVNLSTAKAVISTDKMTVTVAVTFRNGASPVMATFLQGVDVKDNWTGMTQFGNWVYSGGKSRPGPGILGVAASTTEGTYAVYSVTANHTIGAAWLSMIHVLVSDRIVGGTPCQAVYFPLGNTLDLINDTGTALVSGAVGVAPGTPGTLANSRCSINTGLASRSVTDKNVTVTIPMNFQAATFGGMRNVYVNAFDIAGQLSHWVQASTLNVR